jgi:quercetin dioxygenase-like cupin family protein
MSSLDRPLHGDTLVVRLADERRHVQSELAVGTHNRAARTLVKEGALRVTLVALGPGGFMRAHRADGPITIQVLAGRVLIRVGPIDHRLEEGDLLVLAPGIEHAVDSAEGGEFLLTLVAPPSGSEHSADN